MILLTSEDLKVKLEGNILDTPTKRGHSVIETIRGQEITQYNRIVKNLTLNIDYIDYEEYDNLVDMFSYANESINIIDQGDMKEFIEYYISGDTLSLEKRFDFEKKCYYYIGAIILNKR